MIPKLGDQILDRWEKQKIGEKPGSKAILGL
jgi:hypothetical protein